MNINLAFTFKDYVVFQNIMDSTGKAVALDHFSPEWIDHL